jgi:acetylglutamate/LysW-gamma-L-alpha-aminoadipate kinase
MLTSEHPTRLVIKLGGGVGLDHAAACEDIAALVRDGWRVVVVHGGSSRATRLGVELGHPPRFLISPSGHTSRYTDRRTRDIFVMATAALNAELVCALQEQGVNALGLSGLGGRLLGARRKTAIRAVDRRTGRIHVVHDDYSGTINWINRQLLEMLLAADMVPVVAPVAISERDEPLNVDGDRAAAAIATTIGASQLVILSNVAGLMRAYPDETTLVSLVIHDRLDDALSWAQGRMKGKVVGVGEALQGGVERVMLADGRVPTPVSLALAGRGTAFVMESASL